MLSKNNYPALVETMILACVMAVLGLAGLYIIPAFYLVTLLLPVPLAYLVIKRNLIYGLLALAVTLVILFTAFGQFKSAFMIVLQFGPVGLIIGLLLKNKAPVDKSMAVLFFWGLAVAGLNLLAGFVLSGTGTSSVTAEFQAIMEQMAEVYRENGVMDEQGQQQFLEFSGKMAQLVQLLLPGSIAIWTITITMFTYFITRRLLQGLGIDTAQDFLFSEWRLPWYSIWLVIVGLAMTMAGEEFSWPFIGMAGANILYIAAFIFLILGAAVLLYFLQTWKVSRLIKIILAVFLILYFPLGAAVILSLGVVEPVANLRRLPTEDSEGPKGGSK